MTHACYGFESRPDVFPLSQNLLPRLTTSTYKLLERTKPTKIILKKLSPCSDSDMRWIIWKKIPAPLISPSSVRANNGNTWLGQKQLIRAKKVLVLSIILVNMLLTPSPLAFCYSKASSWQQRLPQMLRLVVIDKQFSCNCKLFCPPWAHWTARTWGWLTELMLFS